VAPVASDQPGEDVHGALRSLVERLQEALRQSGVQFSNEVLESTAALYSLTDGVDSTLLELFHDDVGDEQFRAIAATLAAHTFAAQQLDRGAQELLSDVFTMRAARLSGLRANGRLAWVRETGARARLVDSIVTDLVPLLENWNAVESPLDQDLLSALLTWAYQQADFREDLQEAFPEEDLIPPENLPELATVLNIVRQWIAGDTFADIAVRTNRTVDRVLRIYGSVISYSLATLVEQAVAVIKRHLADSDLSISVAVESLPEYLRFGVATPTARALMATGLRHRRAAVLLGNHPVMTDFANIFREPRDIARDVLATEEGWQDRLGLFMFDRTTRDLAASDEATS
jgi:ATP-dependent DNA helicase